MIQYDENLINAEKAKMAQAFTKLGEMYYKAHPYDFEEDFIAPVTAIKDAEARIDQHKTEVLKANGLMLCKHCGSEIQDISRFCNFCGKAVDAPVEEEAVPEPDPEPDPEPVEEPEVFAEPEPEEIQIVEEQINEEVLEEAVGAQEAADEPKEKTCPHCGEPIDDDFEFCTNCGKSVKEPEQQSAPAEEAETVCKVCGSKLNPGAVFCEECGALVKEGDAPVSDGAKVKRCPLCGFSTTDADVNYCVECGSKLQ